MRAKDIILLEKQNYEEMFNKLLGIEAGIDMKIKNEIKWARQNLKRKDRITWYLRLYRYKDARKSALIDEIPDNLLRKYEQDIENKLNVNINDLSWSGFDQTTVASPQMKSALQHYVSLNAPEVQNIEFDSQTPKELMDQLANAEEQWIERMGGKAVQPREDDYKLIEFDGGWAWWVLPRPYCEDEGDSMGHCGNEPTYEMGDNILSLRQHIEQNMYVPHLTFILKDEGYLGEMKGRGNEKPKSKYHPYIVELLLHNKVQGIQGGGYMPENNFSLQDLDEETREELFRKKPQLKPLDIMYWDWRNGGDREAHQYYQKLNKLMNYHDLPYERITDEGVIVGSWSDPFEFIREHGDAEMQHALETITEREIDIDVNYIGQGEIDDLYDQLPRQYKEKIIDYLDAKGENVKEEAPSDLLTSYDELVSMFKSAIMSGIQKGTERAIAKKLIDQVESAEMVPPGPGVGTMDNGPNNSVYYKISHRDISDLLSNPGTEDLMDWSAEQYNFEFPNEHWERIEDFDEDAAQEHLQDEIEHTL